MPITYAGVNLDPPTAEEADFIASTIPPWDIYCPLADAKSWPGKNRTAWPFAAWCPLPPVRPGRLHWPWGASRFAFANFLADDTQLAAIRAKVYGAGGTTYTSQTLILDDSRTGKKISPKLYMLPPRPLAQIAGKNGLYLLPLVDPRYFWWEVAASVVVTAGTTTWAGLISSIATALGVTITADSISANYLKPPADLTARYEYLPLLLDAVLACIGHRFVAKLDGTFVTQAPLTAKTSQDNQTATYTKAGGGTFAFVFPTVAGPTHDLNALVPASVTCVYPRQDSGVPNLTSPYTVATTLASLALAEYKNITAHSGSHFIRDSAVAYYVSNALQNTTELANLSTQISTDWYRWRLSKLDLVLIGVCPWTPEGHDFIDWTWYEGNVSTRVQRGPWDDRVEDLLHLGATYGSQETCCNSTATTPVSGATPTTYLPGPLVPAGLITAPAVISTGYLAETIPAPGAPTLTIPTPGAATITYKIVANTPLGSTAPSSSTASGTAPATITSSAPVNLSWSVPVGVPPALLQTLTYTVFRVATNTTTNANGPVVTVGPFAPGTTPTAVDTGTIPLTLLPTTPVTTGTTGQSSLPLLTGTNIIALVTPQAPAVAVVGTPGVTTYTYEVTALDGTGETLPSSTTSNTTGNATLNTTNYNAVTWGLVPGALSYNVYRTAGGAAQGLIGNVLAGQALQLNDTALVAGAAAPAANTTGQLQVNGAAVVAGATTLTGDVTGSGSGSIATTLANPVPHAGGFVLTDTGTNTKPTVLTIGHNSSNAPVGGFGETILFTLKTTTTNDRSCADLEPYWNSAAEGTQRGGISCNVYRPGAVNEAWNARAQLAGTVAEIGFLGATPSPQLVSPDAGTALVTFGFASGTPTFSAANLTGSAPAASLPVFVAAGVGHARGAVPDPGATSHSNRPMVLKDTAAFGFLTGELLASKWVVTDESTTSVTMVDLATADSVTFTLDVTTTVNVVYLAAAYNSVASAAMRNEMNLDGALVAASIFAETASSSALGVFLSALVYQTSLAAGSHTIKIQHDVGSGTGDWFNRLLMVFGA